MKVPYMDLSGKITFPDDKQITPTEFEGYFPPKQEDDDVSGTGTDISTDHDTGAAVTEAEQTCLAHASASVGSSKPIISWSVSSWSNSWRIILAAQPAAMANFEG